MTREFLGSFCTDVATVVVGDPCKLIRDQSDEDRVELLAMLPKGGEGKNGCVNAKN